MTRFASFCRATLLAAATLAALAPPLAQAGGTQSRPFKATVSTQETLGVNFAACPTVIQGTTTGTGNASHMGKVSLLATDCPILTPGPGQFSFYNGQLTLTAANGDKLTAAYQGQLLPTAQPTVFSLNGVYTVTGGTGRFTGATGSGVLQGSTDIVTGAGQYDVSGRISY